MSDHAQSYFIKLSTTIPARTRDAWEKQILTAEERRRQNHAAMDILGAKELPKGDGFENGPMLDISSNG